MSVDLSFLPPAVRASARVDGWEVSWAIDDAPAAVDALVARKRVVLGLELLDVDADGQYEATPWAIFEPDENAALETNTAASRHAAQAALERVGPEAQWVLISWE